LHRELLAVPRVGGFDLDGGITARQRYLAAASAIGVDAEAATTFYRARPRSLPTAS
jgi:hypothetical protein